MLSSLETDNHVTRQQQEMAHLIERFTPNDGIHPTAIPSLSLIRASEISEPIYSVHQPALCIVAQGSKLVILGRESYTYDLTQYLVASVNLPISGQVVQASSEKPYLCMRLDFDSGQIFDLIQDAASLQSKPDNATQRGLFVSSTKLSLLEAAVRLIRLLDTPDDIPVLAPLFIREMLYRIIQDEHGHSIKQFAVQNSHAQHIAKVIEVIQSEYDKPLRVEQLADMINMSSSSLHYHFKAITTMSPIQFQKQIRLQEARRMLIAGTTDAANAAFQVGYESPSQFSREYARMYGLPPKSDIKRLRHALQIES
ncbi:AraC family transcriptional regulator [Paenibacillus xylanilyticus]|uniref:AraC family transcriptional regulator n=1 Tax=Paenibacillus xylanilyticus TaxID=248903 RepID=A0A7Y6C417_9BACL|nr:AraC family transcriptional regulator [Paenibacillus xylanilyticus]NUU80174.1 AraC family transcriptional regulator [Paenibacillus xylanilyticus]